jgi:hypothetical protein
MSLKKYWVRRVAITFKNYRQIGGSVVKKNNPPDADPYFEWEFGSRRQIRPYKRVLL